MLSLVDKMSLDLTECLFYSEEGEGNCMIGTKF